MSALIVSEENNESINKKHTVTNSRKTQMASIPTDVQTLVCQMCLESILTNFKKNYKSSPTEYKRQHNTIRQDGKEQYAVLLAPQTLCEKEMKSKMRYFVSIYKNVRRQVEQGYRTFDEEAEDYVFDLIGWSASIKKTKLTEQSDVSVDDNAAPCELNQPKLLTAMTTNNNNDRITLLSEQVAVLQRTLDGFVSLFKMTVLKSNTSIASTHVESFVSSLQNAGEAAVDSAFLPSCTEVKDNLNMNDDLDLTMGDDLKNDIGSKGDIHHLRDHVKNDFLQEDLKNDFLKNDLFIVEDSSTKMQSVHQQTEHQDRHLDEHLDENLPVDENACTSSGEINDELAGADNFNDSDSDTEYEIIDDDEHNQKHMSNNDNSTSIKSRDDEDDSDDSSGDNDSSDVYSTHQGKEENDKQNTIIDDDEDHHKQRSNNDNSRSIESHDDEDDSDDASDGDDDSSDDISPKDEEENDKQNTIIRLIPNEIPAVQKHRQTSAAIVRTAQKDVLKFALSFCSGTSSDNSSALCLCTFEKLILRHMKTSNHNCTICRYIIDAGIRYHNAIVDENDHGEDFYLHHGVPLMSSEDRKKEDYSKYIEPIENTFRKYYEETLDFETTLRLCRLLSVVRTLFLDNHFTTANVDKKDKSGVVEETTPILCQYDTRYIQEILIESEKYCDKIESMMWVCKRTKGSFTQL